MMMVLEKVEITPSLKKQEKGLDGTPFQRQRRSHGDTVTIAVNEILAENPLMVEASTGNMRQVFFASLG